MLSSADLQQQFNSYLQQELDQSEPSVLNQPVHYFLSLGGKRLRPVLMLMAADLYHANIKNSLPVGMALELFHNFTLVHDDIMDEASLRRGQVTTHEKYGFNTALLAGDLMLVFAYHYLQQADIIHKDRAWQLINQTAAKVCEGQQLDLMFEEQSEVTVEDYLHMIELKTAVLIGCCLQMGSLLGDASSDDQWNMYQFGRNLGLSFQMQDDLLDTFGSEEAFGKKVGGDILHDKKTFLLLRALEKADEQQLDKLNTWIGKKDKGHEKIHEVRDVFEELHVREEAEQLRNQYYDQARSHIEAIDKKDKKKNLIDFTNQLLFRKK